MALPVLYQAMTSQLSLVRAAAADAYADFGKQSLEDLPELVHQTFLLLFTDPYVIVHSAAVHALREVSLPESFEPSILGRLVNLIHSYSRSQSDDQILSECLSAFLELQRPVENLPRGVRKAIVSIIDKMHPREAVKLLEWHGRGLRGTIGVGALLLKLVAHPETSEYSVESLIEEMYEIPSQEISRIAADFRGAAQSRAAKGNDITGELIEILTAADAWSVAVDIARDSTDRLSDNTWDRPRKLRSAARQVAAEVEAAAALSDVDGVLRLAKRWREVERESEEDHEKNKKRRSPLFGLQLPDPSD
ncbi:MAG TPA: hypothetical protein VKM93_18410 [Terriglobia bacterium]|nr:hypothetical protein [Terriglobia bacterium]